MTKLSHMMLKDMIATAKLIEMNLNKVECGIKCNGSEKLERKGEIF